MSKPRQDWIITLWDIAEEDFPDKSTEFIMQVVCERYFMVHHKEIDHADVAEALAAKKADPR